MPETFGTEGGGYRRLGRYVLCDEIAAGGMATVHFGRLIGPAGFARTVAIKQLHPQYAKSPEFVAMLLDEARLAARIRHPNVVGTLDIIARSGELFIVMDYIQGESFARLMRMGTDKGTPLDPRVVSSIVVNALLGLQAAHEATNEQGQSLQLVHRDVSPQNILVGLDGVTRVLDFGIAKAESRLQTTEGGALKGKLAYMAPEQLMNRGVDRRVDIWAVSVMLWEALVGARLFMGDDARAAVALILSASIDPPSQRVPGLSTEIDALVLKGLSRSPDGRFATAKEMAIALEKVIPPASTLQVSEWVESVAGDTLKMRADRIAQIEQLELPGPEQSQAEFRRLIKSSGRGREHGDSMRPRSPADDVATLLLEDATQASVFKDVDRPRTNRRAWAVGGLAAVLGLAAVVVALAIGVPPQRAAVSASAQAAGAAPVLPPSTSAAPPAPSAPAPPASVVDVRDLPEAAESASADAGTPSRQGVHPRSAPHRRGTPRRKPKPDCNPPYTVDPSTGIKRYKSQCF